MKYKSKICYFRVARKVAFDFQSNVPTNYGMHKKKQIPCVMNMLTRDLFLPRKGPVIRKCYIKISKGMLIASLFHGLSFYAKALLHGCRSRAQLRCCW